MGADRLGRGAGRGGQTDVGARCLGRARVGRVQLELAVHVGDQRRGRLGAAAAPRLRQPELLQLHGALRVGPVPRAALHVRRVRARRLSAGPRERRVHPVLGLQPVRRPPRPCDEHRRGGRPRGEAGRRRPAQGGSCRQGRPLAAGAARHRRSARSVAHSRDDRERLVRRRLRPRLDQRGRGGRGPYRLGPARVPMCRVPAGGGRRNHGGAGSGDRRRGADDLGGPAGRLLHVERSGAAQRYDADDARHQRPLRPDREPGRPGRERAVRGGGVEPDRRHGVPVRHAPAGGRCRGAATRSGTVRVRHRRGLLQRRPRPTDQGTGELRRQHGDGPRRQRPRSRGPASAWTSSSRPTCS